MPGKQACQGAAPNQRGITRKNQDPVNVVLYAALSLFEGMSGSQLLFLDDKFNLKTAQRLNYVFPAVAYHHIYFCYPGSLYRMNHMLDHRPA
jgi:hypothetical protein